MVNNSTLSNLHQTWKQIWADRSYGMVVLAIAGLGLIYVLYCFFTIHSSATQVITDYSGLGTTHFYKGKWYSLYQFAGIGVVMSAVHTGVMIKLHQMGHRRFGWIFGWISLVMITIAFAYTHGVMQLAFL